MAGLSAERREPDVLHAGLTRWFTHHRLAADDVVLSPFEENPISGFSSESRLFTLRTTRGRHTAVEELVLRMPPAGGGLFPEYDLSRQATTQNVLHDAGIPTSAPATYEPDPSWLGAPFVIMPRIAGHIPTDFLYPVKGWLKDCLPDHQERCYTEFVRALVAIGRVDAAGLPVESLLRPQGAGLAGEIAWWSDYLLWATDGSPQPLMADAFAWVRSTTPTENRVGVVWNDARFANAIFDDRGTVVGVLDWEQGSLGPAELDIGFWLATRRQAADAVGIDQDPELPGFATRESTIAALEAGFGRALHDLEWHETFAMIRMGTCIVATQSLLRRTDHSDHPFLRAPPLPEWTIAALS